MSSPTRYQIWTQPLLQARLGQAEIEEPDPDPDDPTDYASSLESGAVQVAIDVGTPGLIQEANAAMGLASPITATFGATPQIGNTLIAVLMSRGTSNTPVTPSGWTRHAEGEVIGAGFDGGRQTFFYKTAGASESVNVTISTSATTKSLYIAEWSGLGAVDDAVEVNDVAATTSMTVGTITPAATRGVLFAGFNQSSRQQTLTMTAGFTESYTDIINSSGPSQVFGYQIVDPFAGPYTATCTSSQSRGYGAYVLSFAAASDESVWYPAPAANDGDDTTSSYSDVAGGPCIRVALEVERLIYRMDLDIGQETAGSTVYELYGTDDASFATSTLLGTLTFTATGSYTLDETTLSWVPTASYQYYEIQHVSGGGDEREVYELRLYSSVSSGGGVTDHSLLSGRTTDAQHPASSVTIADGDDWFDLGTDDVEAALAELAAKAIGVDGTHGSMGSTETFDAAIGWHSGTLTANCTFTLTAAPSGTASSLFLELAQDGTGGWTITLPASVVNKSDIEGEQDTTASETTFLVLLSRDGGTTWYGGWWGGSGGGGAALTVDDGTTSVSNVDTVVFDGATVTNDGGGDVTVTITGGSGGTPSGAKVTKATQNITTATPTVLTFDTEQYDDAAYHDAGSPTRLTIPATGRYRVSAGGFFGFSDVQELDLWIVADTNTTVTSALAAMTTHTGTGKGISVSGVGDFTAGQYLTVRTYHDNASTRAFTDAWFAIERLTSGTGPGTELDYVEKTSNTSITATTEATANTIVTGSAVAYGGSTVVMVEFFAPSIDPQNTANAFVQFWLYDGSSSIGSLATVRQPTTAEMYVPVYLVRRLTPSAATHTYSIRASTSSGTSLVDAGAGGTGNLVPAFIRIITV